MYKRNNGILKNILLLKENTRGALIACERNTETSNFSWCQFFCAQHNPLLTMCNWFLSLYKKISFLNKARWRLSNSFSVWKKLTYIQVLNLVIRLLLIEQCSLRSKL